MKPSVFLLLAALLLHSEAMMFRSDKVQSQWDTWAFVENGTFYGYYLINEYSPGEGFGVATSPDGQHFTDHGKVFSGPSTAKEPTQTWWIGTGSVWKGSGGKYVVKFSKDPNITGSKYQNISFATSTDLLNWTKTDIWFNIDTSYYQEERWDCIYSIPAQQPGERDGYPRYGFWTATPNHCGPYGFCNHTMGFGITHDGLQWEALPPPLMADKEVHWAEVGAVEYAPFGTTQTGAYFAILGGDPLNQAAEMMTYYAGSPEGPWHAAKKNFLFLPSVESAYFARFFRRQAEMMTYYAGSPEGPWHAAKKIFLFLPSVESAYFARFFRGKSNELLVTHQSYSHVNTSYDTLRVFKTKILGAPH